MLQTIVLSFACVGTLGASAVAATAVVDAARARNLVLLDSVVFLLGVGILGGVLVWWGRRIFSEK